jgi:GAF domain-containing protein
VIRQILRTKVGVFIDLYKKTRQIKRQADESVALARLEAARDAAEETNRRLAFLAEASAILACSLDYETISSGLAAHAIPFLGDLCAVTFRAENDTNPWRTDLAWIDPTSGSREMSIIQGELPITPLSEGIRQVLQTGKEQLIADAAQGAGPAGHGQRLAAASTTHVAVPPAKLECAVVVPLRARGRILGTLALGAFGLNRRFGPDDLALAEDLGGRAAIAIDNAGLYRDAQENSRRKNEFLAKLAHELRNPPAAAQRGGNPQKVQAPNGNAELGQ